MTTQSKIALGILGAAAAGVAIGLLIAPEKGVDMRNKIKKTTGGWGNALGTLLAKSKDGKKNKEMDVPADAPAY